MATQLQIKTSPELIGLLGKGLYTHKNGVIVARELLQNSRDACLRGGDVNMTIDYGLDIITCDDTGVGMSFDTLNNVFLGIGESLKDEGSAGGFGIAKVALFAAGDFSVWTRDNEIHKDLIHTTTTERKGTQVIVELEDTLYESTVGEIYQMCYGSNVKRFTLDGQSVPPYKGGRMLGNYRGATVRLAPPLVTPKGTFTNKVIYRIKGLVQYVERISYISDDEIDFNLIVEFEDITYKPTDDQYPFDLSREKVDYDIDSWVKKFAEEIHTDRLSNRAKKEPNTKKDRVKKAAAGYILKNVPTSYNGVIPGSHRQLTYLLRRMLDTMNEKGCGYGLVYDASTVGEQCGSSTSTILVNPIFMLEGLDTTNNLELIFKLWHLLCHEIAHKSHGIHNEQFSCKESEISRMTAGLVAQDLHQLRRYAQRVMNSLEKE